MRRTCAEPPASRLSSARPCIEPSAAWKSALRLLERHAILRPPRSGQARLDRPEIELDRFGVLRIGLAGAAEEPLRLRVRLDQLDARRLAAGEAQVVERHRVDREDRDRGAVLRAHVADRRAVGERQMLEARAVELHELADDAVLAQPLGDGQHQIGRRRALGQAPVSRNADHRAE